MTQVSGLQVAIVGAGLIGRSWSVAFARAGASVRLYDPVPGAAEKSRALVPDLLGALDKAGLLDQPVAAILARYHVASSLEEALSGCDYVQESAPENQELKAKLFAEMDPFAGPGTILASSTSIILPSLFTGHLNRKTQCIVVHPLNPPHLIPAVEIVPAPWTSPETVSRTRDIITAIGQKPVVMMKEIDGFLMNRLQGALLEECWRLLEGGYADVEDIDVALKEGLALRWSFVGPFETMDLNAPGGLADYVQRYLGGFDKVYAGSQHRADWKATLGKAVAERRAKVPLENLADRQAWRDRQMVRLAKFRKDLPE